MVLYKCVQQDSSNDGVSGKETRNVIILSIVFTFEFTAYLAVQNLQSSLNQEEGLGVTSLSCLYALIIVSSILAPSVIKVVGIKLTLLVAWISHILYTASNFYPTFYSLLPTSFLLGLISGPMWTSQSIFVSTNSYSLAQREEKDVQVVLSKMNGIFFTMFGLTQIAGNLISSLVLNQGSYNDTLPVNSTLHCGSGDCPMTYATEIVEPERQIVYILLSIFLVFNLCGLVLTIFFLPPVAKSTWIAESNTKNTVVSCFTSLQDVNLLLLVPFIAIMAMHQAVLWTDFTKSYISCPIGIKMVGFVMACNGGSVTIFSLLASRVAKYTGRNFLFAIAAIVNMSTFGILYVWKPQPDDVAHIFVLAVCWGIAEGIWQTQSNAFIAYLFKEKTEPAFANYHCWKATSFTVYFVISNFLCVYTKLIIVMSLLTVAIILYIVVEIRVRRKLTSAPY